MVNVPLGVEEDEPIDIGNVPESVIREQIELQNQI